MKAIVRTSKQQRRIEKKNRMAVGSHQNGNKTLLHAKQKRKEKELKIYLLNNNNNKMKRQDIVHG